MVLCPDNVPFLDQHRHNTFSRKDNGEKAAGMTGGKTKRKTAGICGGNIYRLICCRAALLLCSCIFIQYEM
jgi:hypothetical protein